jgi:hypothetical protein
MDQHGYFGILSMKKARSGRVVELFLKGNANLLHRMHKILRIPMYSDVIFFVLSYAFHLIFVVNPSNLELTQLQQ